MHGLCIYLDCNVCYFKDFKAMLRDKTAKKDKDFSLIIARIEGIMYNQKFTGAAAGFLNPSIICRDLGLVDKKDLTTDGEKLPAQTVVISPFDKK